MSSSLIGSLLQSSCLFISRPVNNLPDSISVILHLSFTLSPFPHHEFLIKGSALISLLRYALTGIFPASRLPPIRLRCLLQPTYFSLLPCNLISFAPKAIPPQLFFFFHFLLGVEQKGASAGIKYAKAWRRRRRCENRGRKWGGRGSCWCSCDRFSVKITAADAEATLCVSLNERGGPVKLQCVSIKAKKKCARYVNLGLYIMGP